MGSRLEKTVAAVLIASMLVIAGSVVYRTIKPPPVEVGGQREVPPPTRIDFWEEALEAGLPLEGNSSAPVVILTLTDFECPACRGFHTVLEEVLAEHPERVQVLYAAYPLDYHRFARSASRGAECAWAEGKFGAWAKAVFGKQDSLGLRTWAAFAHDAGLPDTMATHACANGSGPSKWIDAGVALGERLELTGVPLVLVNGWRFHRAPSSSELKEAVSTLLAGRDLP